MPIKLQKTLYVGLGGTGTAVLLRIKKFFAESYGEIPPMIGFLAIDTDNAASNKSVTGNNGETIRLDASELLVCTVKNALDTYRNNPEAYDWIPRNNIGSLAAIKGGGAGQVRSNGRFIAFYNYGRIMNTILTAVSKINELIPHGSEFDVDPNQKIGINVIASIAGGTGSGMLVDVLSLIHNIPEDCNILPWIVFPDVFQAIDKGPMMEKVMYNSYGAIRTLDYIMDHDPEAPEINLGHTKVDGPLFGYAYIINNMNRDNVSFNDLDDLADVVAESAFLHATPVGAEVRSSFDDIILAAKEMGTYNIRDKKAWAASAGSAELVYDGKAVGRAMACSIISQLCDSMLQSPSDGSDDARDFVNSVAMTGKDDVINAICASWLPPFGMTIDADTTESDITAYITNNCGEELDRLSEEELGKKMGKTESALEEYINRIIMTRPQGQVDAAIKFMNALLGIISNCKEEMEREERDYQKKTGNEPDWKGLLKGVKKKGWWFIDPIDADVVEDIQMRLSDTIGNLREEMKRKWGIRFYTEFKNTVNSRLQKTESLRTVLEQIGHTCNMDNVKQGSGSKSSFRIFLHEDDVKAASRLPFDDAVKAAFKEYIGDAGMASWTDQSKDSIRQKLWDFATGTPAVQEVASRRIDDILKAMPEEKVKGYLSRLKELASPFWTYDTLGYPLANHRLDELFVIGAGNSDTSIFKTDPRYETCFDASSHTASFASTNQHDRVYVIAVEALLPIFAVNNFKKYMEDTKKKERDGKMIANYIDERLKSRMESEHFSLMPGTATDNVLKNWVLGFVFGLIHCDDGCYWIRSEVHGAPIYKFRHNLSSQRNVAFDMFKSEGLYQEVEEELEKRKKEKGIQFFNDRVRQIKENESYKDECASLSPTEESGIDTPPFKPVRDLLDKEIRFITGYNPLQDNG